MKHNVKKYGLLIIAAVLLMTLAFAGAGAADEMTIANAGEWMDNVAGKPITKDIRLTGDIDFSTVDTSQKSPRITALSGNFYGDYHTISNFTIERSGQGAALIGTLSPSSCIENLTISHFSVSGSGARVGGLVAVVDTVSELSGEANAVATLKNVRAEFGTVKGTSSSSNGVGGLVGYGKKTLELTNCTVENCMVTSLQGYYVGGLLGHATYSCTIESGNVIGCSVSGKDRVGGLTGTANSNDEGRRAFKADSCKIMNSIISAGNDNVGAIAGLNKATDVEPYYNCVEDCIVEKCTIVSTGKNNVGGFFGSASKSVVTFNEPKSILKSSAIRGDKSSRDTIGYIVGSDKNGAKKDDDSNVKKEGTIWLNNNSNAGYPTIYIAKSADTTKRGPETLAYFHEGHYGEPAGLNAKIVTRLSGYGQNGAYSAIGYVYETVPEYAITNTPSSNVTVLAYNATTPAGTIDRAKNGDSIHLVAEKPGYHFVSWNVTDSTGALISPDNEGNFAMPNKKVNVDAISYANTTTVVFHNESVTDSKVNTFGSSTVVPANPTKPGYMFSHWNVSSTGTNFNSPGYNNNGVWNYTGVHEGTLDVYANWTEISYQVTVTNADHGSASASPNTGVVGTQITLTATENPGYMFVSWNSTNPKFTSSTKNPYTFAMPASSLVITPTFAVTEVTKPVVDKKVDIDKTLVQTDEDVLVTFRSLENTDSEEINFVADSGGIPEPEVPTTGFATLETYGMFQITRDADDKSTSDIVLDVTLKDSSEKDEIYLKHYTSAASDWDKTHIAPTKTEPTDDADTFRYTFETDTFSPFAVVHETETISGSHRGHSASLPKDYTPSGSVPVMVQETAKPTTAPTLAAPTMMPTTQPTQKSPAPLAGLIAGLGAAALLIRMRR